MRTFCLVTTLASLGAAPILSAQEVDDQLFESVVCVFDDRPELITFLNEAGEINIFPRDEDMVIVDADDVRTLVIGTEVAQFRRNRVTLLRDDELNFAPCADVTGQVEALFEEILSFEDNSIEVARLEQEIVLLKAQEDFQAARIERFLTELDGAKEIKREHELLSIQVGELRTQLSTLQALLDEAEAKDAATQTQLSALGAQLNASLARLASEQRRIRELEAAADQ